MNCKRCGSSLNPNDLFCVGCGAPVNSDATAPFNQEQVVDTQSTMGVGNMNDEAQSFGMSDTNNVSQATEVLDMSSIRQSESENNTVPSFEQPGVNQNSYKGQALFNSNMNNQINNYEPSASDDIAEKKTSKMKPLIMIAGVLAIIAITVVVTIYFTSGFNIN